MINCQSQIEAVALREESLNLLDETKVIALLFCILKNAFKLTFFKQRTRKKQSTNMTVWLKNNFLLM